MRDDDVRGDELLREVLAERFPSWQSVLNEESRARDRAIRAAKRNRDALLAAGVDRPTDGLDELAQRRIIRERRRVLDDALAVGADNRRSCAE